MTKQTIDISKINKVLSNLKNMRSYKKVATKESDNYHEEKNQEETGIKTEVYDIGEGFYLKIVKESDSYGSELGVSSVQFVIPIQKTITDYEAI